MHEELELLEKKLTAAADILPIQDIGASYRFVTLSKAEQLKTFLACMIYRIQCVMYKSCKGNGKTGNQSWARFVLFMRQVKLVRTVARLIVRNALKDFRYCGDFHFDVEEVTLIDDSLTWDEFLHELLRKGPLWHQVMMAFLDALVRLDLDSAWEAVDPVGALKQSGEQEA